MRANKSKNDIRSHRRVVSFPLKKYKVSKSGFEAAMEPGSRRCSNLVSSTLT